MAQAMINKKNIFNDLNSKKKIFKDIGVQTGDLNEQCITISETKKIKLYYSKSY